MRIFPVLAAGAMVCGLAMAQQPASHAAMKMTMVSMQQQAQDAPVAHEAGVPPFHRELPQGGAKVLPETLPPSQFSDPRVQKAYAMAAEVRAVLYQQPCYCGCDKEVGHHSLLDCFAGDHASICQTCMMEGVYAFEQTKAGKTPTQIRAAIESGAWRSINLNDLLLPQKY